jgi:hypothetical protein
VLERGFEGYVAKDEASVYESGETRRSLKVKQKEWTVEGDGRRRRVPGEGPMRAAQSRHQRMMSWYDVTRTHVQPVSLQTR